MPPEGYTSVTLPNELAQELGAVGDGNPANGVRMLLANHTSDTADADAIAETVAARLEGSKPLEDMAFDDWWEPDYAQTIALSIVDELEDVDIAWDEPEQADTVDARIVDMDASERRAFAEEVAEVLQR